MDREEIEESIKEEINKSSYRESAHGDYHPSTITGCPLKALLDKMTETETILNSWMFHGTAVHEYLYTSDILRMALHNAGYHTLDTEFEVNTRHKLEDDITITGTCDAICSDGDSTTIFDVKYTSLKPSYGHGRIFKYLSQVNTYAHMFGADEYALITINSKSNNLLDDIAVMPGNKNEENWQITKEKAAGIHNKLEEADYPDGNRWERPWLESRGMKFWKKLIEGFDIDWMPTYEKECNHCDHSDYCPVYNNEMTGMGQMISNERSD